MSGVDEGRTVNVVYLKFDKTFETFFCEILIDRLIKYALAKWTVKVD